MSEQESSARPAEGGAEPTPAADRDTPTGHTFTQADVNRLVGEARKKERAKWADMVPRADLDALAAERDAAVKERDALAAKVDRAAIVQDVATQTRLPYEAVSMLTGADADTLRRQAATLKEELRKIYERRRAEYLADRAPWA